MEGKMKKLFFLIILFLLGCSHQITEVKVSDVKVGEVEEIISYNFILNKPVSNENLEFEDDIIKIKFSLGNEIKFDIENKYKEPIKIIWDQASIVKSKESIKLIHSNVKFDERREKQIPTTIIPNTYISESAFPLDNVDFKANFYALFYPPSFTPFLMEKTKEDCPLLPKYKSSFLDPAFNETIYKWMSDNEEIKKTTLGLLLPLDINNEVKNYYFEFLVSWEYKY
jgi:hypothetical protein